jgi:Zinc carboxypeptidase
MFRRLSLALLGAMAAVSLPLFAQTDAAQPAQKMDPDYAASVKQWTTKPEFTSPLVDHLPAATTVPSPKDVLGYWIGAPKKLTYHADILRYYDALAAHTGRVKVIRIGKTEEGRESVIVFVGSEDSIAHLDEERANMAKIADPRGLSDAQEQAILAKTKPIYALSGGLHSAELGPPEMLMELAYRLATEDSPLIEKIRQNVIVAIVPVADPDGRDRSIDWYYDHNVNVTDYSKMAPLPYWGKYIMHDNNRDINYSAMANQNLLRWYLEWHPVIMHDLHESVPFLYVYSGEAPQNPLWSPILYGELPMLSNWDMSQLTKYGMPGVWTHAYVDAWSPGYVAEMATDHNGLMRFYEIFGNDGATTMERTVYQPNPAIIGGGDGGRMGNMTKREWYRPNPPYTHVLWSIRDNINYAETGVLTSLEFVSAFPQAILSDFYVKSRNAVEAGTKEKPYGFVIPSDQQDMTRVAFVIHILRMQGIEVGRAKSAVTLSDGSYPAGSLIVKTNQPYGPLAKTLLGKQVDPDPELTTYDDSAWTMGLMTHTEIKPTDDIAVQSVAVDLIDEYDPEGTVTGARSAAVYAVADHGSPNMVTLRYALKDAAVEIAEKPFTAEGKSFAAGTFLVSASAGNTLKPAAEKLGLDVVGLAKRPDVAAHAAALPRVAVFSTWNGTQDVGWVRYTFDQYKVPYDLIFKERVLEGNLAKDYDVIVIPTQARSANQLMTGIPKQDEPLSYEKSAQFKFLGDYGSSPDITGGMGGIGVAEFQKFVEEGGTLVTLGASSLFPPAFGITPNVDTSAPAGKFYAPGPIVEADIVRRNDPIFYGYTDKTVPVRYANGPLFRLSEPMDKNDVLMRYPGGEKSVLSGLFNGADSIKGRAAIVATPEGKGEVVMFATNPVWRWQNLGEYRMMFNTLMNYKNLRPGPMASPAATDMKTAAAE